MILNVVVPVILILLMGYLFGKYTDIDQKQLSRFAITVLSPALIFSFMVRNDLSSTEMIQIIVVIIVSTIVIAIFTIIYMKWTKKRYLIKSALLVTVFSNSGNFGLPILLFAYGDQAFALGVVIVAFHFILMYSLGIYFASMGNGENWKSELWKIFRLPTTLAAISALLISLFRIDIPDYLFEPIKLVGEAAVPVVLLILGIQLSRNKMKLFSEENEKNSMEIGAIVSTSTIKLVVSPIIVFIIVHLTNVDSLLAKVLILMHAMPTAVIMTMIAIEYNSDSDFVSNSTFVNTILSFISITALLYLLEIIY